MTTELTQTLTIQEGDQVIGWVHPAGSCGHPACKRATREGRPYHAIPKGGRDFSAILPEYHYASVDQAIEALKTKTRITHSAEETQSILASWGKK